MACTAANCSKVVTAAVHCPYCSLQYCSTDCQVQDWNKAHQYICSVFTNFVLSDLEELTGPEQKSLGKGSYGEVKLFKHKSSAALYAIKIIQKEFIQKHSSVSVLLREIEIHRNLRHANIVQMIKCFEDDEKVYIVLEYASKGSLFRIIRRNKGLKEDVAWKYFSQTCLGIKYLHDKDIMHRDLKPENILIDRFDNVKICDFGWCVQSNELRNTFCGTLEYMAPEMLENKGHSYPVDLWALGILLFELINGDAPFVAKSDSEKRRQILNGKINFTQKVSAEAQDLISGLVKALPEERLNINQVLAHPWIQKFCVDESLKGMWIHHPSFGAGEIVEHLGLVCMVKFGENFSVVAADDTRKYLEVPRVSYSGIEKEAFESLEKWCGRKKKKDGKSEEKQGSEAKNYKCLERTVEVHEKPVKVERNHARSGMAQEKQFKAEFSGVFEENEAKKIEESRIKHSKVRQRGFGFPFREPRKGALYTKDSTAFQEVFTVSYNVDISEAALKAKLDQLEGLRKSLEATKYTKTKKAKSNFWDSWFGCLDR